MNPWVFQKFEEWLDNMPLRQQKNLEYDRFARFADIEEDSAREYFELLNKDNIIIKIINMECPNCGEECSIDTDLYKEEFECKECEELFNYNDYKRKWIITYKINNLFIMQRKERKLSLCDSENNVIDIQSISRIKPLQKESKDKGGVENSCEVKVFFSYSHEDRKMRDELEKHLIMLKRKGIISTWHDKEILAGSDFSKQIDENLLEADIILLLISIDFLASEYCYEIEMKKALERHKRGEAVVIPVILRECDWSETPFQNLKALPLDGKSVELWESKDSAFLDIEKGIKEVVNYITNK